ncbi:hypothetical protein HY496_02530 [Candidatus Woesearchaeota archaeon]|nr:hypothetical protein [Candidatus Woesearchaeota archaeon]
MIQEWLIGSSARILVGGAVILVAAITATFYLNSYLIHRECRYRTINFFHAYAFGIIFLTVIIDFLNSFQILVTGILSRVLFLFSLIVFAAASYKVHTTCVAEELLSRTKKEIHRKGTRAKPKRT